VPVELELLLEREPKERVRLDKETRTDEQEVVEHVRKRRSRPRTTSTADRVATPGHVAAR
jgi:hypothetical protein